MPSLRAPSPTGPDGSDASSGRPCPAAFTAPPTISPATSAADGPAWVSTRRRLWRLPWFRRLRPESFTRTVRNPTTAPSRVGRRWTGRRPTAGCRPAPEVIPVADRPGTDSAAAAASAPLQDIPIFSTAGASVASVTSSGASRSWVVEQLRHPAGTGPRPRPARGDRRPGWTREVDWPQVVLLRKTASEVITGETQAYLSEHGRPMPAEDRLLMGRAVIRRVVNDHVRALHREGAALWSPETERTYAQAVEDSIFGYGRMQPLFEI